jgi:hypothetical protein
MTIGPGHSLIKCQCMPRVRHNQDTYKRDNARPVSINVTVLSEPRGWLMRTSAPRRAAPQRVIRTPMRDEILIHRVFIGGWL